MSKRTVVAILGVAVLLSMTGEAGSVECEAPPSPYTRSVGVYSGFSAVAGKASVYVGGELGLGYALARWRFGWETAFGFGTTGNGGAHFTTTLSAAYFFQERGWSPYLGLGAGYALISPRWQVDKGFAAEPRLGVELLRERPTRLNLMLACTLPAFIGDFNNQGGRYHTYIPVYRFATAVVF